MLTSSLQELIQLTDLDDDSKVQLDDITLVVEYINSLLTYDKDYDVQVFMENALGNEEDQDTDNNLFIKLKHYSIETLKRMGISISNEVELGSLHGILVSIRDILNLDRDTIVELYEDINSMGYAEPMDKVKHVLTEYTGVEEETLNMYMVSCSDKIFNYIEEPMVNDELTDNDLSILSKIEYIDRSFLTAPILKDLIALGKTRLPSVYSYNKYLLKYKIKHASELDLALSITLILMHANPQDPIIYSSTDTSDPNHYLNLIKDLNIEEYIQKDGYDMFYTILNRYVNKTRGIKL